MNNDKKNATKIPEFLLTLADEVIVIAKRATPTSARQLVAKRLGDASLVAFNAGYERCSESGKADCGGPDRPGSLLATHIKQGELRPMFLEAGISVFEEADLFYYSAKAHSDCAFTFDQLQAALGALVQEGTIYWDKEEGLVNLTPTFIEKLYPHEVQQTKALAQTPEAELQAHQSSTSGTKYHLRLVWFGDDTPGFQFEYPTEGEAERLTVELLTDAPRDTLYSVKGPNATIICSTNEMAEQLKQLAIKRIGRWRAVGLPIITVEGAAA